MTTGDVRVKEKVAHFELVKQQNKKIVRNVLRDKSAIGISELAQETGLSYPTVSNLLKELSETGEVREHTTTVCKGGRPATQYCLNAEYQYGITMILEKNGLSYVVVDVFCKEVERGIYAPVQSDMTLDEFLTNVKQLKQKYSNIKTIALGIPGVATENEIKMLDIFPNLEGTELSQKLKEELDIKLVVENDSNAMALAHVEGEESFAQVIYLRKCVGTGIVINGSLFRGIGGYAGELESICQNLEEPVPAMIEVVKNITGVLNLGKIYLSADCELDISAVMEGLGAIFSAEKIPELIIEKHPKMIYEKGLIERLLIVWREQI